MRVAILLFMLILVGSLTLPVVFSHAAFLKWEKSGSLVNNVPFISQAPLGDWEDLRQKEGCEEASVLMAVLWARGQKMKLNTAEKTIINISEYERKTYGYFQDSSAKDTLERIFKGYFSFQQVRLDQNIEISDIDKELFKGNVLVAPVNGQSLNYKYKYYSNDGPLHHMILIIGVDQKTQEYLINDPGSIRGASLRFPKEVLYRAIGDYESGVETTTSGLKRDKVMIVVSG